jgi:hypothetical protein
MSERDPLDPKELRRRAAQARHAAAVQTESGQAADRQLIALARRLERQADALEGKAPPKPSSSD